MTLSELKKIITYIIKRETFFSRSYAERMADDILEEVKEYMEGDK